MTARQHLVESGFGGWQRCVNYYARLLPDFKALVREARNLNPRRLKLQRRGCGFGGQDHLVAAARFGGIQGEIGAP
jgi:hypothetical protein